MPIEELVMTGSTIKEYPVLKPDTYDLYLTSIEDVEAKSFDDPNTTQTRLVWTFVVDTEKHPKCVNEQGEPIAIKRWTSTATGPKSTAREFVSAILGRPTKPDERFRIREELVNGRLRAVINYRKDKNGNIVQGEDGLPAGNIITSVMPITTDDDGPIVRGGAASHKDAF